MSNTAKENWDELIIKPLDLPDGETGRVKFYRVIRKVEEIRKKHNKLIERLARLQGCEHSRGPATLSDEKAMPSGELQPVNRCSPPSEAPKSFDELREKFCRCVVPVRNQVTCVECGLPIYDDEKED